MGEPAWVVKGVIARDDYTLDVSFADGSEKRFDARGLLEYPAFAPLKSIVFFKRARVMYDTVAWSDEIDIAPEHLYEFGTTLS